MKAILTLIFVLIIGITAQAQDAPMEVKVETIKTTIVTSTSYENVNLESNTEVARLYKFKILESKSLVFYYQKKQG